ncbi:GIY-YIG nuclease family protein [Massilia sp. W12]|uniref:GIY-YIG nuclease family protein n=1 Tax=Massilia sp. W12 TaxID=3126507 RepID=UPI0030D07332
MSATVKIFLVHGEAKRLRTAELSNWTGKAITAPRHEFAQLCAREELQGPGVYVLTGVDGASGLDALAIGEADCLRQCLRQQLGQDFWNNVICFVSKDGPLGKPQLRYLAARLTEIAQGAGRAQVNHEPPPVRALPESERADMEGFLHNIRQLLPALGCELLVPSTQSIDATDDQDVLYCDVHGLQASGTPSPSGFVVFAGSQTTLEVKHPERALWIALLREQLLDEGLLEEEDDCLRFARDIEFPTPACAAAVIHGAPVQGLHCWKDSEGLSLAQIEQQD